MNIKHYAFGSITIDDMTYTSDVIIYPERVQGSWWRREGHRLDVKDLIDVVRAKPGVLIVGTGFYGNMKVPDETQRFLQAQGIELKVAPTPEAVELFNTMRGSADIVAALHLTC